MGQSGQAGFSRSLLPASRNLSCLPKPSSSSQRYLSLSTGPGYSSGHLTARPQTFFPRSSTAKSGQTQHKQNNKFQPPSGSRGRWGFSPGRQKATRGPGRAFKKGISATLSIVLHMSANKRLRKSSARDASLKKPWGRGVARGRQGLTPHLPPVPPTQVPSGSPRLQAQGCRPGKHRKAGRSRGLRRPLEERAPRRGRAAPGGHRPHTTA